MKKQTIEEPKKSKQIRLRPDAYANAIRINSKQRENSGESISLETTVNEILTKAKS